ncbi:glycosyl transferase [Salinivibrio kushneri]|uniref:Glycosyl transferase n=1 Tax=Salinivibrio kushneri TaxID=1908198 RepID=A0AB36JWP5_9GAMM|nr:glycosyltransferase family 2 protein [Salinivibrio kushneri]OOE39325.1 glycosyl transferase [Salinivibrio kushneri]QCP02443.1 glycosyltransferase family 2 protein [Salinivibrio kushneri]
MKVSIITPSYNSIHYISDTIDSIRYQTLTDWEMIIVDDCSSDNSVSVIKSYTEKDSRIKLIQLKENSGAAVARNAGIEAAQGRYIAFLDSDDLWLPDKLEKQLVFMQQDDIAFSFSAYHKIDEEGVDIGTVSVPENVSYHELLKCCVIGCLTAMYDTKKIGKVYMPLIRKRQDFGLWLRILKKCGIAYGIAQPLAKYRVRKDSISSNKLKAALYNWKLYREVENLNLFQALYYFSHYAINGVLRIIR